MGNAVHEPGRCSFLLRKLHGTLEMGWKLFLEILGIFPLLRTSVIANSCLYYVLLDSMAVGELVVLIGNSFDKRSTDEL